MNLLNGWTVETALKQIEDKNGWEQCLSDPSTHGGNGCVYRNHESMACAVGAFIPDDYEYMGDLLDQNPAVEHGLFEYFDGLIENMPLTEDDLTELQKMHDGALSGYIGFDDKWNKESVKEFLTECSKRYVECS